MDPTREEEKREGEERWWRSLAAKRREERWRRRRAAKRREERWWRRRAAKRRNLPLLRREGKGREEGQAMAAGQADPPTPSSNLGLRIHPCPRLPPPSPAPPPQPPLPPSPLARPTPAPLRRRPRAPRAADAGGGGEVSSEEWQRWGTYSPLPSVVASIVHQLLEMESVAGEKTSGVADRPSSSSTPTAGQPPPHLAPGILPAPPPCSLSLPPPHRYTYSVIRGEDCTWRIYNLCFITKCLHKLRPVC